MTPAARYAAAIAVLDRIIAGTPAEQALTSWARGNRFAGSKDRAAIRDHVFDVLRQMREAQALGGGPSGRALVLGLLRLRGVDPSTVFGVDTYAPPSLTSAEETPPAAPTDPAICANLPDWLWPLWAADLGARAMPVAQTLSHRAGVFLRVNLRRGPRAAAQEALAADGIVSRPLDDIKTALEVTENHRRIAQSNAYKSGLVELQDPSGQAAMARLAENPVAQVLDYCAGGGGKALALADLMPDAQVVAHDIDAGRMADLPTRAARAGVTIARADTAMLGGGYDLVLCDAPCTGSGTWRRTPHAKLTLTPDDLADRQAAQREVLHAARDLVVPQGVLAYATCSVLSAENEDIVADFLTQNQNYTLQSSDRWWPSDTQDGFFLAVLKKTSG